MICDAFSMWYNGTASLTDLLETCCLPGMFCSPAFWIYYTIGNEVCQPVFLLKIILINK